MKLKLFRSWNIIDDCFYYFENGRYYYFVEDKKVTVEEFCFNWFNSKKYTGLLDKNGNKIFEFDLVIDKDGNKTAVVWIKEWSMFGCMFLDEFEKYKQNGISQLDDSMFWTFPIENNLIEVIGNIHEL